MKVREVSGYALLALGAILLMELFLPIDLPLAGTACAVLLVWAGACLMSGRRLAFGAEPLTLMLFYLLFDAEDGESACAALTVTLFSMAGKLVTTLIRARFSLPDAGALLWLLPGAILGALLAMLPPIQRLLPRRAGDVLLRLSLFTSLLNMAASSFG